MVQMLVKTKKRPKPTFSQNVIARRKALGWSQLRLADESKLGLNTIKAIELGKSGGWPDTKEAIAKALKCSVDDLNAAQQKVDLLSPIPKEVWSRWRGLSPEGKALCLYVLTENDSFFDFLDEQTQARLLEILRILRLKLPSSS